ncbi:MAG: serine protease [Acidobacteriia bacterium]|nr:serine protease [Terriglobia bacterium]
MFRLANKMARDFTRPVVMSRRTVAGKCTAGIGAYVIVNDEGIFLTAFHIVKQWHDTLDELDKTRQMLAAIKKIQDDQSLKPDEKRRQIKKMPKPHSDAVTDASLWLGTDRLETEYMGGIEEIDLGFGKLKTFDPKTVATYPTLKDDAQNYEPGVSLCRLGYPLFEITPTFDPATGAFLLPRGTAPPPFFASEGMLARMMEFQAVAGTPPHPFPMRWIETSSPGLKGQSGGPIFDEKGTIWAIQSNTECYPLGFEPEPRPGQKLHQFLSVGRGVHITTVLGLLRQQNIKFSLSTY